METLERRFVSLYQKNQAFSNAFLKKFSISNLKNFGMVAPSVNSKRKKKKGLKI